MAAMNYPLDAGSRLLTQIPALATEMREAARIRPIPDSTLDRQVHDEDDFVGGCVETAASTALLRMVGAEEHLATLGRLIFDPTTVYSTYSVARTAAELAARAWWLLDPDIDAGHRAERNLAERFYGFGQLINLGIEPASAHAKKRIGYYIKAARAAGFDVRTDRQPPRVRQARPSGTKLLEEVYSGGDGPLIYRLLSAFTHGTTYAMDQLILRHVDPGAEEERSPGFLLAQVGTDHRREAMVALMALQPYIEASRRQAKLNGWDSRRLDAHLLYTSTEFSRQLESKGGAGE